MYFVYVVGSLFLNVVIYNEICRLAGLWIIMETNNSNKISVCIFTVITTKVTYSSRDEHDVCYFHHEYWVKISIRCDVSEYLIKVKGVMLQSIPTLYFHR